MSTSPAAPAPSTAVTATAAVGRARPAGPAGAGGQPGAFARLLQGMAAEAPDTEPPASNEERATAEGDRDDVAGAPGEPAEAAPPAARRRGRADDGQDGADAAAAGATSPPEQRAASLGQAGWLAAARARAQAADAAGRARHAALAGADDAMAAAREPGLADTVRSPRTADAGALALDGAWAAAQGAADPAAAFTSATDTASANARLPGADPALPGLAAAAEPGPAAAAAPEPAAEAQAPTAQAMLAEPPGSAAFTDALGAQLRTWLEDGTEHASLELNPRELGPIDVRIALRDGQTLVELAADVGSTRQALAEALPALAEALGEAGLSLAGGSVHDQTGRQARDGGEPGARAFALPGWLAPADEGAADHAAPARSQRGLVDLVA